MKIPDLSQLVRVDWYIVSKIKRNCHLNLHGRSARITSTATYQLI